MHMIKTSPPNSLENVAKKEGLCAKSTSKSALAQTLADKATASVRRGIAAMMLYATLQSVVWGLVRYLASDLSTETLFFFRNLFGFFTILPLLFRLGPGLFATRRFSLHLLRAGAALAGGLSVFYAIAHVPLATVVAVTYTAPIFASLFAMMVLKEGVTGPRIFVLLVGFLGTLMVLQPSFDVAFFGLLGAIAAAITTAIAYLAVKGLSGTERAETIVSYPFLLILPVSALLAYYNWTTPSWSHVPLLMMLGAGISAGQYFLTKALAATEASVVLPMDFIRLLVAVFIGIFAFGDSFDSWVVIGAIIILSATVYGARMEKKAKAARDADES